MLRSRWRKSFLIDEVPKKTKVPKWNTNERNTCVYLFKKAKNYDTDIDMGHN